MTARRSFALVAITLAPGTVLAQTAPSAVAPVAPEQITVIATSPLLGSGIDRNLVPAETNVLSSSDLARGGTSDVLRALNDQVGGVNLESASGNPYQPTLLYHGFQASPLQGSGEGLAVYVNGARFNQAFGDTVNWELLPSIAIDKVNLEGSNPVFGLNALGGALSLQMKNGFTYQGVEADVSGGSFDTIQAESQYGLQRGNWSFYAAGNELHQDGWRDLQSSDIQNFYGDLGWRNDRAEAHVTLSMGNSVLNGPGTSPIQLLQADPAAQFTAPNLIANRDLAVNVNGSYRVTDTLSVQAVAYYQYLLQRVVNGNSPNDFPCDDGSGLLCSDVATPSTTRGGGTIPDFLNGGPYSELDTQTTNSNGYGTSVQGTETGDVFGMHNHLVFGGSFDGAKTTFDADGYLGGLTPISRVFTGPGIVIDEPGNNVPVRVDVTDAYYGLFAADTLSITDRLAVSFSGRFNSAQIGLADQNGGDLTGRHAYNRVNPAVGAVYKFANSLSVYAGYSESNRAPTPAELSCAGPLDSCSLANFFVGDPDLKQVVAHTVEAGFRGRLHPTGDIALSYDVNLFRTVSDNDIAFENSVTTGRAFFQNVGQTRRQGVDAGMEARTSRWHAFVEYSYTQATYQTTFVESGGSNPDADANGNITITPGDTLPGVPTTRLKFGAETNITDKWMVGFNGLYQSGQFLFGDDANLTPRLQGFVTVDLTTSYQITPHLQVFGRVENVGDARYYTYGTFSPTSSVFLAQAPNATNPRSYSPAAPIGGFGGVKVTF
jgi:iron complex outermembrane receptor protein